MTKIVGVRFRHAGRIYYFAPGEFEITPGMNVIVMTARGIEYGTAVSGIREIEDDQVPQGLRPIQRIATEEDTERALENREREREALAICKEKIRSHGLEMKLIDAEYTFDNNKILFYFTADGRVDFRELVKDLAGVFRTRIELRQIGVRDETKILGGIGICGRPLCCHSYLSDFIPVSIRMAKEQNLSLNPTKISGVCGRLMCCLKNEEATYEYLNSRLPRIGEYVTTSTGLRGEVSEVSVLRQKVKVLVDNDGEKEIQEYSVEELKIRPRKPRGEAQNQEKPDHAGEQDRQEGGSAPGGRGRRERDGQHSEEGGRRRGAGRRGEEDSRSESGQAQRSERRRRDGQNNRDGQNSRDNQNTRDGQNSREAQNGRGRRERDGQQVKEGQTGEKRQRRRSHNKGGQGEGTDASVNQQTSANQPPSAGTGESHE